MADKKISALTGASTPLAGTEVLPIVQSGATVKVSIANVTAGREVATSGVSFAQNDAAFAAGKITYHSVVGMVVRGNTGSVFDFSIYAPDGTAVLTQQTGTYVLTAQQDFKCNGNFIVSTSGKGIDFSATPGTGTSELLADYEEGTWTPVGTFTTQGTASTSNLNAYYTKVGRAVTLLMYITVSKGTAVGTFTVTGIPYAPATSAACACRIDGMGSTLTVVAANITSTTMNFSLMNQSTAYSANVTAVAMATDCYIQVTCTYNI
jgi:hypothetical protein